MKVHDVYLIPYLFLLLDYLFVFLFDCMLELYSPRVETIWTNLEKTNWIEIYVMWVSIRARIEGTNLLVTLKIYSTLTAVECSIKDYTFSTHPMNGFWVPIQNDRSVYLDITKLLNIE